MPRICRSVRAGAHSGRTAVCGALLGVVLLAGCAVGAAGSGVATVAATPGATSPTPRATQSGRGGPSSYRTTASRTARSPRTTTSEPTTRTPDHHRITLAFAGDIHFERQLRPRLDHPDTALAPIRRELAAADLTMANLETAITTGGAPEPKRYTFHAAPAAFEALADAGVDVVTMANNHGVDYGGAGLADTLHAAGRAPLAVVGIGADAHAAFAPYVARIRGARVAVIGADAFADPTTDHWAAGPDRPGVAVALQPDRLLAAVATARRTADVVVVYLHWGIERVACPTADQTRLARQLADAGADIVVGSHAHVQLGAGRLGRTFVAYGLGNFVWYGRNSTAEATTGVLTLTVQGRRVVRAAWAPATVGADGLPRFAHGERAAAMSAGFARLRRCTDLAPVAGLGR